MLGPNDTGKTTLLRCLLGLNKMKKGEIAIAENNVNSLSVKERAAFMAYVLQSSSINFPYAVSAVVLMGRLPHLAFGSLPKEDDKGVALGAM